MTVIGINVVGMCLLYQSIDVTINSRTDNSFDDVYSDEGSLLRTEYCPWRGCFPWAILVHHERVLADEGGRSHT